MGCFLFNNDGQYKLGLSTLKVTVSQTTVFASVTTRLREPPARKISLVVQHAARVRTNSEFQRQSRRTTGSRLFRGYSHC